MIRPDWTLNTFLRTLLKHGMPHFENSYATRGAPILAKSVMRDFGAKDHLNWRHLEMIRQRWKGRLVIKGIMSKEDACIARDSGVQGIVVSNHGGRQLDGAVSPLRVLPAIVEAVGSTIAVMMDGGVRRGSDVLKAIALGAAFVFVGRPFIYAAAIGGEAGVSHAINILSTEISRTWVFSGSTRSEKGNRIARSGSGAWVEAGVLDRSGQEIPKERCLAAERVDHRNSARRRARRGRCSYCGPRSQPSQTSRLP